MKRVSIALTIVIAAAAHAQISAAPRVELFCHRTANEDVPENTLESLEQAALLGCDVVEIDLRRTLDGKIVLNHDGLLERLTDGIGETEKSFYGDLALRETGAWMGDRFTGMHIATFEDALRLARDRNLRLILDIKTKGIGEQVLALLRRENMLDQVQFGGEWTDVKELYPDANASDTTVWVEPGTTTEEVKAHHSQGELVIANFSANEHAMDLPAMKAAVSAGVDGINVDYPRLGADAVGRPVEERIAALTAAAEQGGSAARAGAILELSRYRRFSLLERRFAHWLLDADGRVSRAAALALVTARPRVDLSLFAEALRSQHDGARANAAWALGMVGAPASTLLFLLKDTEPHVQQEALLALARMPGEVSPDLLLPLLTHGDISVRGVAALALARHQPVIAAQAIRTQLQAEVRTARVHYEDYVRRGKPQLSDAETQQIFNYYRCQMKMVQALSMLRSERATQVLEEEAFRPGEDFSQMNGVVAGFELWDRLGSEQMDSVATRLVVEALGSKSAQVADRAEWMLIQAGPAVLPAVRKCLDEATALVQTRAIPSRAIRIVAWQGDMQSIGQLRAMKLSDPANDALIEWAIDKIETLHSLAQPQAPENQAR